CSGDMKLGVPTTSPERSSGAASAAWEIPKSITRGPSRASSTLDGLRSPCTTPAAWIALRLLASPAASASSDAADSGPRSRTASDSDGPFTYAVASQGTWASTSASATRAVNRPLTFLAAATSTLNRARNSGSAASPAWMIFTATGRPAADTPRNTRPMPPAPSRPISRYGPISRGSDGCSTPTTPDPTPTPEINVTAISDRPIIRSRPGNAYGCGLSRAESPDAIARGFGGMDSRSCRQSGSGFGFHRPDLRLVVLADQRPAAEQGTADDRAAGEDAGDPPERGVVTVRQR